MIDYDRLEENAALFRPQLLICGASAYPRDYDYARFRKVADQHGAYLLMDMAHTSGLIAAGAVKNPFEWCDVVTTTTHKTLRGPRAGLIFFRKRGRDGQPTDLEGRVNQAVFPSNQGGPHNNTIAGIAVALKQVASPSFAEYGARVCRNAKSLAAALQAKGYKIVTDGTDNHIVLWDLRPVGLTGSKFEKIADRVQYVNFGFLGVFGCVLLFLVVFLLVFVMIDAFFRVFLIFILCPLSFFVARD